MRIRAESHSQGPSGVDSVLLDVPFCEPIRNKSGEAPEVNFYVVRKGGVQEVGVFLTQDLLDRLRRSDHAVWQGVLEFVEDDLLNRSSG
jgi:hypothetical protein